MPGVWRRLLLLVAAVQALTLFTTPDLYLQISNQADQIEDTAISAALQAERLRAASIQLCIRQNDVREEASTVKNILASLVATSLRSPGHPAHDEPEARADYQRQLRRLRQPIPEVTCRREFPDKMFPKEAP